jgi:hypothetical protein
MRRHCSFLPLLSLLLLFVALPRLAAADPISLNAAGVITHSSVGAGQFPLPVEVGDPFRLALTIETPLTLDSDPSPTEGLYWPLRGTIALSIGSGNLTSAAFGFAEVRNSSTGFDRVRYQLGIAFPSPHPVFGFGVAQLRFFGGEWIGSDALPTAAVVLREANTQSFAISDLGGCERCGDNILGTVLRITDGASPAPIPEPNSLLLVGTGLLSAVGVRRWRQRKAW